MSYFMKMLKITVGYIRKVSRTLFQAVKATKYRIVFNECISSTCNLVNYE